MQAGVQVSAHCKLPSVLAPGTAALARATQSRLLLLVALAQCVRERDQPRVRGLLSVTQPDARRRLRRLRAVLRLQQRGEARHVRGAPAGLALRAVTG